MPEPRYPDDDDDMAYMATVGGAHAMGEGADGMAAASARTAWMPLICKTAAEDIIRSASTNVRGAVVVRSKRKNGLVKIVPEILEVILKVVDFRRSRRADP